MSMTEVDDLQLFPRWRQAVRDFLAEFEYGDTVSHDWLAEHFGMPTLDEAAQITPAEFRNRQFEWLASIDAFRQELLTQHQVCLQSVRGLGYRWVPPHEQTSVASTDFERDIKKSFRVVGQKLRHTRVAELTDDERRIHSDAIAKVSALKGMTVKALK